MEVNIIAIHHFTKGPTYSNYATPAQMLSCVSLQTHGLSLPGSSVHEILQARMLEWVAI